MHIISIIAQTDLEKGKKQVLMRNAGMMLNHPSFVDMIWQSSHEKRHAMSYRGAGGYWVAYHEWQPNKDAPMLAGISNS